VSSSGFTFGGAYPNCTLSVTPVSNAAGTSIIRISASDGTNRGYSVRFNASFTAVDDSPVTASFTAPNFSEDTSSIITLSYTDPDNDTATTCSTSGLNHVTISQACACSAGVCTVGVIGAANYFGSASFDFTVTANTLVSNTSSATLTITQVADETSVGVLNYNNSADYTGGFDANKIFFNSGLANLLSSSQTDNSQTLFNLGTYSHVVWDGALNAVMLQANSASLVAVDALDVSWTPQYASIVAY